MPEETKNEILDQIDEVVEATTEESVTEIEVQGPSVEIVETNTIPTTEEAQAYIDALNDPTNEGDKTLLETIYEEKEEDMKKDAKSEIDKMIEEGKQPEVILDNVEKEKEIEKITDDIANIVDKDISQDKLIEQLTTMFINKEEEYKMQIARATKQIALLEKIVNDQTEELSNHKYGENKVAITDDFMGTFITFYKQHVKEPTNVEVLDKLANFYLYGYKLIHPELEPSDVYKLIKDKREASLRAIQGMSEGSEKDTNIKQKIKEQTKAVIPGIVIG